MQILFILRFLLCASSFALLHLHSLYATSLGGVCTRNNLHYARETICTFSMKLHLHSSWVVAASMWFVTDCMFNNGRNHGYLCICGVFMHPAVFAARAVHTTSHLPSYSFWSLILCSRSTCASRFYLFTKFLFSCKVYVVLAGSWVIAGLFVQSRPRKHHQIRILNIHSKTSVIHDPPFIVSDTGTFLRLCHSACVCHRVCDRDCACACTSVCVCTSWCYLVNHNCNYYWYKMMIHAKQSYLRISSVFPLIQCCHYKSVMSFVYDIATVGDSRYWMYPDHFVILYCTLISIAFHGGQLALRCRGGEYYVGVHHESVFASRAAVDKYSCDLNTYAEILQRFWKLSLSLLIFHLSFIPLYLNTTC